MAKQGMDQPPGGNDWGAFASSQPGSLPSPGNLSLSGVAFLSLQNVFTDVNTFARGIRFRPQLHISSDYTLIHNDFELLVDASSGPVAITLPEAVGDGQLYRVKKIDSSSNQVVVVTHAGDLIDGATGITLVVQWDSCLLIDSSTHYWDKIIDPSIVIPADIARKGAFNEFTNLNEFTGIRLAVRTVTSDYALTTLDFEVLVDASGGPVHISLPVSKGNGQYYRIKKIDSTDGVVTIAADGADLIDDSTLVALAEQWADCTVVDAALGYWDNAGGGGGGGGSVTSAQLVSVNTHIDTVSARAVSISAELNSLLTSVEQRLSVRIDLGGGSASVTSNALSVRAQTASAAATSADAHANAASAAATSADAHANTVSARAVSISAELTSLLASTSATLETHINSVSNATSNETSARQSASAALETHVNVVSARGASISAELGSLVQIASAAATSADVHAGTASAAATSANSHANVASAAATLADAHANTVSVRVVSVSAELVSLINAVSNATSNEISARQSASAALETHINAVSAAGGGTSATSAKIQTASAAATSADAHAAAASAAATSVLSLVQNVSAASGATSVRGLQSVINHLSVKGVNQAADINSVNTHVNTVSARVVSVSAELASLVQIASAAATSVLSVVQNVSATSGATSVRGLQSVIDHFSVKAVNQAADITSVNTHVNTVSARAVSISAELNSLLGSVESRLSGRIDLGGGTASVTSNKLSAVKNASTATSSPILSNAISNDASVSAVIKADIDSVSAVIWRVSVASGAGSAHGLQSVIDIFSNRISAATGGAGSVTSTELSAASAQAKSAIDVVSARVVSVSAELVSLVQIASAAATSANTHANTASAAATSADAHANTVSSRVVSVSAELASLLASASAAIEADIHSVSAVIKADIDSVSAKIWRVSVASGAGSARGLQSVMNLFSARFNTISAALQDFEIKDPVVAATTGALPFSPTYSNGTNNDGIGATLTGSVGILAFDGYTPASGDRLLIKNQGSAFQNGVYTVTTVGTALVGYVLTRALDFNQAANIVYGDTVAVLQGTVNANQQFTMNNQTAIVVGTDSITFAQTSGGSQLTAGTGISITGNTVAVDATVAGADAHAAAASAAATSAISLVQNVSAASGATSVRGLQSVIDHFSVKAVNQAADITSVNAHVNTVSNAASNALSVGNAASNAASIVSARAASISAEVASLVQIASAAATSADAHANTVSARAASISAEVASLVQIASAAATSADAHANTVSARAASISAEVASLVQIASAAATSADAHASAASAAATSADGHANTVSARAVSISAEVVSLAILNDASLSAVLQSGIDTVSSRAASIKLEVMSNLRSASIDIMADVASHLTSAFAAFSVRSVGNVSTKGMQSVLNALSNRISAVVGGTASVTSDKLSAVKNASTATSSPILSNAMSAINVLSNLASNWVSDIGLHASNAVSNEASVRTVSVDTASAAATSADAHANTVSVNLNSTNFQLASVSAALETHINTVSNAASNALSVGNAASNAVSVLSNLASNWVSVTRYMPNTTHTDTDYTLVLGDADTTVVMNSTAAHNLTVPPNSSVAFPVGAQIIIEQGNTGAVTIVAGAGVTLQGAPLLSAGQYSTILLIKQATNTWLVSNVSGTLASISAALHADIASASAVIKTDIASVSAAIKTDIASVSAAIKIDAASAASVMDVSLSATLKADALSAIGVLSNLASNWVSAAANASTATSSPALSNAISNDLSVSAAIAQNLSLQQGNGQYHVMTAGQTLSTGTFTKLSGLSLSIGTNNFYRINGQVNYGPAGGGSATAVFQFGMSANQQPGYVALRLMGNFVNTGASSQISTVQYAGDSAISATPSIMYSVKPGVSGLGYCMFFDGVIKGAVSPGIIKCVAATSTLANSGTTILAGSFIQAYRIG